MSGSVAASVLALRKGLGGLGAGSMEALSESEPGKARPVGGKRCKDGGANVGSGGDRRSKVRSATERRRDVGNAATGMPRPTPHGWTPEGCAQMTVLSKKLMIGVIECRLLSACSDV